MISGLDQGLGGPETAPWEPKRRLIDSRGLPNWEGLGPALGSRNSSRTTDAHSVTHMYQVQEYVKAHPGEHVRSVGRTLGLANGDLQYHLVWLERHGFVKTRRSGFYRFVYPAMVFNDSQEVLLGLLTQETPRELLLCLIRKPNSTQRDLATELGHSQPTISWHMDRLIEAGVATKTRAAKGVAYRVVADEQEILRFVKAYHPVVWRRWEARLDPEPVPSGRRVEKGGPIRDAMLTTPAVVKLIRSG